MVPVYGKPGELGAVTEKSLQAVNIDFALFPVLVQILASAKNNRVRPKKLTSYF